LIESAVPSAIANRRTGKAQIRSKKREISQSTQPPWYPASKASTNAKNVQMIAEPMPTFSEFRPP
jgi:hypothetical protein